MQSEGAVVPTQQLDPFDLPYPLDEIKRDRDYVSKKLGYTAEEFDSLMKAEPHPAQDYPNAEWMQETFAVLGRFARRRAMT